MEQDILVILVGIDASKGRKPNLIDKGVTFVRRFFYYTYNKCNCSFFFFSTTTMPECNRALPVRSAEEQSFAMNIPTLAKAS